MNELEVLEDISKKIDTKFGAHDTDIKALSDAVRELKAKAGRISTGNDPAAKSLRQLLHKDILTAIQERKDQIGLPVVAGGPLMPPVEVKTVANISSSNLTGDAYQSYLPWQPGMEPTGQYHFRNLAATYFSSTDNVQFPRAKTPIGEGSFNRQTEAAAKQQVDRDYEMISVLLKPMAAYAILSRQSLRNILFIQSWLPTSLINQLEESEDTDFANALVAAATGSTATTRTVVPEKIISYLKTLIKNKYNPNAIVVDPELWEDIIVHRPGVAGETYSNPGPVVVTADGNIRIMNRPVIPVPWLTGRRIIVGDFTKLGIVQSEGMILRQSDSHASIFTTNEIAFLLERTENLAIFRPDAFITTTM